MNQLYNFKYQKLTNDLYAPVMVNFTLVALLLYAMKSSNFSIVTTFLCYKWVFMKYWFVYAARWHVDWSGSFHLFRLLVFCFDCRLYVVLCFHNGNHDYSDFIFDGETDNLLIIVFHSCPKYFTGICHVWQLHNSGLDVVCWRLFSFTFYFPCAVCCLWHSGSFKNCKIEQPVRFTIILHVCGLLKAIFFMSRTPDRSHKFIIGPAIIAMHCAFIFYLHYGFHEVIEGTDWSIDFPQIVICYFYQKLEAYWRAKMFRRLLNMTFQLFLFDGFIFNIKCVVYICWIKLIVSKLCFEYICWITYLWSSCCLWETLDCIEIFTMDETV